MDLKKYAAFILAVCLLLCFAGCSTEKNTGTNINQTSGSNSENSSAGEENSVQTNVGHSEPYTTNTKISDVLSDATFGNYGRLIFPADSGYYGGDTLGELSLTWYSHIDPNKTVEIANYMKSHAGAGETIFYDIYSDEEKAADPGLVLL